jgi:hypothetical protein
MIVTEAVSLVHMLLLDCDLQKWCETESILQSQVNPLVTSLEHW